MATGPEHYREAERLARQALPIQDPACALVLAQLATAHAILADVAVTAASAPVDGSEPGMAPREWQAWNRAIGGKSPEDGEDR
ncbi:hypothetical protein [Streptomyces sp. NPDC056160]|uniref:hypothetical protein n=1 Tax=Streptomyces sp. NPDC056160 TaxID=3345731 RepID=UPI0035E00090